MAENYQRTEKVSVNEKSFFRRLIAPTLKVVAFLIVVGGTIYFIILQQDDADNLTDKAEASEKVKELTYFELEPPIIANFSDSSEAELIQISITFLTEDIETLKALEKHQPKIRDNLLTLISTQNPIELKKSEGKEKLRSEILEEVRKILKEMTDQNGIKEVLFTSFVMQ